MADASFPQLEASAQEFLLSLLDTPAPSGFEDPAGDAFERYGASFASARSDEVGNRYVTANEGADFRVALVGHLDEIGFIVNKVEKHGVLRFSEIGGWDPAVPVGQRVTVLTESGPIEGAISRVAVHQLKEGRDKVKLSDLWIDIGAVDEDDARSKVQPGDPVVLRARPLLYPNGRLMSRSLDDRIGAFVAVEVARRCVGLDVEVVAVGSMAEENSFSGARTSAFSLKPDVACAVDVHPATDTPGTHGEQIELGKGPVVSFGAAARTRIGRELLARAAEEEIQVQRGASGRTTGTDAEAIVASGAGIPVGVVGVPTRYLHTPCELLDLRDVCAAIDLLEAWIRGISRDRARSAA